MMAGPVHAKIHQAGCLREIRSNGMGSTIPWTGPGFWTGLWTGLIDYGSILQTN